MNDGDSEELELEALSDTSPPDSLPPSPSLSSPLLQLEPEPETSPLIPLNKSGPPNPSATKSAWKNIVSATPPKQSIDPVDWPKPAAAAMIPSAPPPRMNQPAPSIRNSQERASALPPTASW